MFSLLKKQAILDEESIQWMIDTFDWAIRNLDGKTFFDETPLVVPSNEMFPGRAASSHEMAQIIFDKVMDYAGLSHWPCFLVNETEAQNLTTDQVALPGTQRGQGGVILSDVPVSQHLPITYNEYAINNPEVLIANFAHVLSHYLGSLVSEPPPGGQENWPHITELLAVFLGFGVIMANTAHTNKVRSCGSCAGPIVERTNFLSQLDMTYALAIFCVLKDIPTSKVKPYLKGSLWSFFKKAYKDAKGRLESNASIKPL